MFKDHIDLTSILREHDKEGLGIINSITFTFLLNEYVGIPEDKIMTIIKVLDPSNKHLINFADFIRLVHDNSSLDSMPLFKLGEKVGSLMAEHTKSLAGKSATHMDGRGESLYFTPAANIPGIPELGAHNIGNLVHQRPPTPSGPDRGPMDSGTDLRAANVIGGMIRSTSHLPNH